MSGGWDLNPRPSPWQGDILPLNYRRIILFKFSPFQYKTSYPLRKSTHKQNKTCAEGQSRTAISPSDSEGAP